MKLRQIKDGPDAYFVDVLIDGRWYPWNLYCAIPLNTVRRHRRWLQTPDGMLFARMYLTEPKEKESR